MWEVGPAFTDDSCREGMRGDVFIVSYSAQPNLIYVIMIILY